MGHVSSEKAEAIRKMVSHPAAITMGHRAAAVCSAVAASGANWALRYSRDIIYRASCMPPLDGTAGRALHHLCGLRLNDASRAPF